MKDQREMHTSRCVAFLLKSRDGMDIALCFAIPWIKGLEGMPFSILRCGIILVGVLRTVVRYRLTFIFKVCEIS